MQTTRMAATTRYGQSIHATMLLTVMFFKFLNSITAIHETG
jgi:hypothetical protein